MSRLRVYSVRVGFGLSLLFSPVLWAQVGVCVEFSETSEYDGKLPCWTDHCNTLPPPKEFYLPNIRLFPACSDCVWRAKKVHLFRNGVKSQEYDEFVSAFLDIEGNLMNRPQADGGIELRTIQATHDLAKTKYSNFEICHFDKGRESCIRINGVLEVDYLTGTYSLSGSDFTDHPQGCN